MSLSTGFEGDTSFNAVLDKDSALNATFEGSDNFNANFDEGINFNATFNTTDATFGSSFGEMYGLHIDESESIIALSVEPSPDGKGNNLTYIKASGVKNTIFLPDKNTTYSLGTDTETGLTKIYATTGNAEDGTMSQRAITTELRKKVSVSVDETNKSLVFTTK
jgi:hypothetical protein